MKVIKAETLGFCFGVDDAIKLVQKAVSNTEKIYSLGPIIHNQQVIDHLSKNGLKTVDSTDELEHATVVIRAHGVPPSTMNEVKARSSQVIDATCVLVRRAQNAVKQLYEEGYSVVVIGDSRHPEVKGIMGYAPDVTVIADEEGLVNLPKTGRLGVIAQTTLSQEHFATMVQKIILHPFREIKIMNTLCLEVVHRQEAAVALCHKVDVMFVLGGLHSANTRELAQLCRAQNVPTYHLESWDSFLVEYVTGRNIAGVTAGASTPSWIIDQFVKRLEAVDTT